MKHVLQEFQGKTPVRYGWFEASKQVDAQGQEQRIAEHAITYFKQDGDVSVRDEPIDFPKAKSEIEALGHCEGNHFIGFENNNTRETVQFAHYGPVEWHADVPIPTTGPKWSGYVWGCDTGIESIIHITELFINEESWFGTLPFTMRKPGKSQRDDGE